MTTPTRTSPRIPTGHTHETDSPSETFHNGHYDEGYDPRRHIAPGEITVAEMRAANDWAKANPRKGISAEGVRDVLQHEYDVASHKIDGRAHVQFDVWHEQLFGLGRALESARVAARFPEEK